MKRTYWLKSSEYHDFLLVCATKPSPTAFCVTVCRKEFPLPSRQLPKHRTEQVVEVELSARVIKQKKPKTRR
jgi:hypothetical protein